MIPPLIFITGFMGSGKSTVGPLIAGALGYAFVDLDAVIEEKEKQTIPGIFGERGEQEFRAIEKRELELLAARERIVVATGGGALTATGSYDLIRSAGILVYLRVDPDVLYARLSGFRGRPMIAAPDGAPLAGEALRARIGALLASREPRYMSADIVVDATVLTPEATVESILRSLRAR